MAKPFRDKLSDDLDARYDKLLKVIDDGMAASKKVTVSCVHCRKRSDVDVPDVRAAIAAADFFAAHAHGRPGTADNSPESEKINFVRLVVNTDSDVARILEAARTFIPEDKHIEFLKAASRENGSDAGT